MASYALTASWPRGAVFVPKPLPFDRIALPGHPQDRDQICPACKRNGGVR